MFYFFLWFCPVCAAQRAQREAEAAA